MAWVLVESIIKLPRAAKTNSQLVLSFILFLFTSRATASDVYLIHTIWLGATFSLRNVLRRVIISTVIAVFVDYWIINVLVIADDVVSGLIQLLLR